MGRPTRRRRQRTATPGTAGVRRAPMALVVDRRCQPQTRATVERMLAGLDDPAEREAYLRSVRGQAWGATTD